MKQSNTTIVGSILIILILYLLIVTNFLGPLFRGIDYYNLQAQALIDGRLHLYEPTPKALLELKDPWDPEENAALRRSSLPPLLWDASFYNGKVYSYFGVVPAVLLFAPYKLITGGGSLSQAIAVFVFATVAFLFACATLNLLWRRLFPSVPDRIVGYGLVTLGISNYLLLSLAVPDTYMVAVSSAQTFLMIGIYSFSYAFLVGKNITTYALVGTLAFALCIGCRPHVAVVLAIVVIAFYRWWLNNSARGKQVLTAIFPAGLVIALLALFNWYRFDSVTEFGLNYQLSRLNLQKISPLAIEYILPDLYFFLFHPPEFIADFPFLKADNVIPSFIYKPEGYWVEYPIGLLFLAPTVILILCAPIISSVSKNQITRPVMILGFTCALGLVLLAGLIVAGIDRYLCDFAAGWIMLATLVFWWFYVTFAKARWLTAGIYISLSFIGALVSLAVCARPLIGRLF